MIRKWRMEGSIEGKRHYSGVYVFTVYLLYIYESNDISKLLQRGGRGKGNEEGKAKGKVKSRSITCKVKVVSQGRLRYHR